MAAGDRWPIRTADNRNIAVVEDTAVKNSNGTNEGTLHVTVDSGGGGSPSSTANTPAIVTTAGTAIAANTARKAWSIQNLDTDPLFVLMGSGASTSVFHFVLKAGSVADDGLGGIVTDNQWLGIVTVSGTTPRFVVSELT